MENVIYTDFDNDSVAAGDIQCITAESVQNRITVQISDKAGAFIKQAVAHNARVDNADVASACVNKSSGKIAGHSVDKGRITDESGSIGIL